MKTEEQSKNEVGKAPALTLLQEHLLKRVTDLSPEAQFLMVLYDRMEAAGEPWVRLADRIREHLDKVFVPLVEGFLENHETNDDVNDAYLDGLVTGLALKAVLDSK